MLGTAGFQIVRSSVLGLDGPAPSEKLNIAGIGVAGVDDLPVLAADMLQMRRRVCERAGSRG